MQLRSGRNTNRPRVIKAQVGIQKKANKYTIHPKNQKVIDDAELYISNIKSRSVFISKMKENLATYEKPENQNFIGSINYFRQAFVLVLDNYYFDNIESYDFSGRLIPTIKGRIDYWRTNLPKILFNRIIEDDLIDVEKTFELIRKTNDVVESVAKKFQYPKKQ